MNTIEIAVRFGKGIIVNELDSIDGWMVNLIRKDIHGSGLRKMVRIGDKMVDYQEGFKLYLSTRNKDICIGKSELGWITLVNFTVTRSGLEGKLLSLIINKEKPDLE